MKKVLITYSSYGSGHKSIAQYIKKYFDEHAEDCEVKLVNITDYCNFFGRLSVKFFNVVINHRAEHFFDACYEMIDNKLVSRYQDHCAKLFFDNKRLRQEIMGFQPDISINSHFYGGNIINYYNKKGYTKCKIISVLTDYAPHYCWLADRKDQDAFVVANEVMKKSMIEYGVDGHKVYPYGIPFDKDKAAKLDADDVIYKRYHLNKNIPTFVMFGGGSGGLMAFYHYFKAVLKQNYPINLVFISGKNQQLKSKCDALVKECKPRNVKVLGFTNDVYNLLKIANCVISKPGGATLTECMEMNTPLILMPGLGGQEKYNARFIKFHGYGTMIRKPRSLIRVMDKIMKHPEILEKWQKNLEKQAKTDALTKIYKLTEKLLKK